MKALERRLGLFAVIALSMSAMLGSLFLLPGVGAKLTGPSIWLAFLVAAICVLPATLSKSELATAMPTSGGTYVYIDQAFGPLVGTVFGMGLWLALLLKSAFALIGFGAYLRTITDFPLELAGLGLLVCITALNIGGAKIVKRVQVPVFILSMVGLLILVAIAIPEVDYGLLDTSFPKGGSGFVAAIAFIFVSFAGVTKIAAVAEEVKEPTRNLPRGMLLSLFGITVIYFLVVFMMVTTIPDFGNVAGSKDTPVYLLAENVGGRELGVVAAILAIVTMVAMANVGLLAASRFPFAMSRGGQLPQVLGRVSPRFVTPVVSIVVTSVMMGLAIIFLDLVKIAKLASTFKILVFMAVNATVIVLRETNPQWYKPGFKAPLYPWLQLFGIATGVVLLAMMGTLVATAVIATVVLGCVAYYGYGRKRALRRGVVSKLSPRPKWLSEAPDLDSVLPSQASVIVPLFGAERSPEMLIEMGAALAHGRKVEVIHVKEVPEQTNLAAMLGEDLGIDSLRRRIDTLSEEQLIDVEFDAVVSRDVARSLYHSAQQITCDWMVMEWRSKHDRDIGTWRPKEWLLHHMPCNIATFKDNGIRYIREIMVTVEEASHEELVVSTADHLAVTYGAELTFVHFIPENLVSEEIQKRIAYVETLREECVSSTHTLMVYGTDEVRELARESARYDLIVTTAPWAQGFWSRFRISKTDRLTAKAACSVLRLS